MHEITFATEPWDAIEAEILPLWRAHWREVADPGDRDRAPLDPNWAAYQALADCGALHITTARRDGWLVGYAFVVIERAMHYQTVVFGVFDLYWIAPAVRGQQWLGVRLFREVERALKERGVQKMIGTRKLWLDTGAVFRRCGWKDIEIVATKWIG